MQFRDSQIEKSGYLKEKFSNIDAYCRESNAPRVQPQQIRFDELFTITPDVIKSLLEVYVMSNKMLVMKTMSMSSHEKLISMDFNPLCLRLEQWNLIMHKARHNQGMLTTQGLETSAVLGVNPKHQICVEQISPELNFGEDAFIMDERLQLEETMAIIENTKATYNFKMQNLFAVIRDHGGHDQMFIMNGVDRGWTLNPMVTTMTRQKTSYEMDGEIYEGEIDAKITVRCTHMFICGKCGIINACYGEDPDVVCGMCFGDGMSPDLRWCDIGGMRNVLTSQLLKSVDKHNVDPADKRYREIIKHDLVLLQMELNRMNVTMVEMPSHVQPELVTELHNTYNGTYVRKVDDHSSTHPEFTVEAKIIEQIMQPPNVFVVSNETKQTCVDLMDQIKQQPERVSVWIPYDVTHFTIQELYFIADDPMVDCVYIENPRTPVTMRYGQLPCSSGDYVVDAELTAVASRHSTKALVYYTNTLRQLQQADLLTNGTTKISNTTVVEGVALNLNKLMKYNLKTNVQDILKTVQQDKDFNVKIPVMHEKSLMNMAMLGGLSYVDLKIDVEFLHNLVARSISNSTTWHELVTYAIALSRTSYHTNNTSHKLTMSVRDIQLHCYAALVVTMRIHRKYRYMAEIADAPSVLSLLGKNFMKTFVRACYIVASQFATQIIPAKYVRAFEALRQSRRLKFINNLIDDKSWDMLYHKVGQTSFEMLKIVNITTPIVENGNCSTCEHKIQFGRGDDGTCQCCYIKSAMVDGLCQDCSGKTCHHKCQHECPLMWKHLCSEDCQHQQWVCNCCGMNTCASTCRACNLTLFNLSDVVELAENTTPVATTTNKTTSKRPQPHQPRSKLHNLHKPHTTDNEKRTDRVNDDKPPTMTYADTINLPVPIKTCYDLVGADAATVLNKIQMANMEFANYLVRPLDGLQEWNQHRHADVLINESHIPFIPLGKSTILQPSINVLRTNNVSGEGMQCALYACQNLLGPEFDKSRFLNIAESKDPGMTGEWHDGVIDAYLDSMNVNYAIFTPLTADVVRKDPCSDKYLTVIHGDLVGQPYHWVTGSVEFKDPPSIAPTIDPTLGFAELQNIARELQLHVVDWPKWSIDERCCFGYKQIVNQDNISIEDFVPKLDGNKLTWRYGNKKEEATVSPEQCSLVRLLCSNVVAGLENTKLLDEMDVPGDIPDNITPVINVKLAMAIRQALRMSLVGRGTTTRDVSGTTERLKYKRIPCGILVNLPHERLKTGDVVMLHTPQRWISCAVTCRSNGVIIHAPTHKTLTGTVAVHVPKCSYRSTMHEIFSLVRCSTSGMVLRNLLTDADVTLGVPGCGKTNEIIKLADEDSTVLAMTRCVVDEVKRRGLSKGKSIECYTMEEAKQKDLRSTVIIDEATMITWPQLATLKLSNVTKLILFGDPYQIGSVDMNDAPGVRSTRNITTYTTHQPSTSNVSLRIGQPLMDELVKVRPQMQAGAQHQTTFVVEYMPQFESHEIAALCDREHPDVILCFYQDACQRVQRCLHTDITVTTVHRFQGKDAARVMVLQWNPLKSNDGIFRDPRYTFSAATRAINHLTWVSVGLGNANSALHTLLGTQRGGGDTDIDSDICPSLLERLCTEVMTKLHQLVINKNSDEQNAMRADIADNTTTCDRSRATIQRRIDELMVSCQPVMAQSRLTTAVRHEDQSTVIELYRLSPLGNFHLATVRIMMDNQLTVKIEHYSMVMRMVVGYPKAIKYIDLMRRWLLIDVNQRDPSYIITETMSMLQDIVSGSVDKFKQAIQYIIKCARSMTNNQQVPRIEQPCNNDDEFVDAEEEWIKDDINGSFNARSLMDEIREAESISTRMWQTDDVADFEMTEYEHYVNSTYKQTACCENCTTEINRVWGKTKASVSQLLFTQTNQTTSNAACQRCSNLIKTVVEATALGVIVLWVGAQWHYDMLNDMLSASRLQTDILSSSSIRKEKCATYHVEIKSSKKVDDKLHTLNFLGWIDKEAGDGLACTVASRKVIVHPYGGCAKNCTTIIAVGGHNLIEISPRNHGNRLITINLRQNEDIRLVGIILQRLSLGEIVDHLGWWQQPSGYQEEFDDKMLLLTPEFALGCKIANFSVWTPKAMAMVPLSLPVVQWDYARHNIQHWSSVKSKLRSTDYALVSWGQSNGLVNATNSVFIIENTQTGQKHKACLLNGEVTLICDMTIEGMPSIDEATFNTMRLSTMLAQWPWELASAICSVMNTISSTKILGVDDGFIYDLDWHLNNNTQVAQLWRDKLSDVKLSTSVRIKDMVVVDTTCVQQNPDTYKGLMPTQAFKHTNTLATKGDHRACIETIILHMVKRDGANWIAMLDTPLPLIENGWWDMTVCRKTKGDDCNTWGNSYDQAMMKLSDIKRNYEGSSAESTQMKLIAIKGMLDSQLQGTAIWFKQNGDFIHKNKEAKMSKLFVGFDFAAYNPEELLSMLRNHNLQEIVGIVFVNRVPDDTVTLSMSGDNPVIMHKGGRNATRISSDTTQKALSGFKQTLAEPNTWLTFESQCVTDNIFICRVKILEAHSTSPMYSSPTPWCGWDDCSIYTIPVRPDHVLNDWVINSTKKKKVVVRKKILQQLEQRAALPGTTYDDMVAYARAKLCSSFYTNTKVGKNIEITPDQMMVYVGIAYYNAKKMGQRLDYALTKLVQQQDAIKNNNLILEYLHTDEMMELAVEMLQNKSLNLNIDRVISMTIAALEKYLPEKALDFIKEMTTITLEEDQNKRCFKKWSHGNCRDFETINDKTKYNSNEHDEMNIIAAMSAWRGIKKKMERLNDVHDILTDHMTRLGSDESPQCAITQYVNSLLADRNMEEDCHYSDVKTKWVVSQDDTPCDSSRHTTVLNNAVALWLTCDTMSRLIMVRYANELYAQGVDVVVCGIQQEPSLQPEIDFIKVQGTVDRRSYYYIDDTHENWLVALSFLKEKRINCVNDLTQDFMKKLSDKHSVAYICTQVLEAWVYCADDEISKSFASDATKMAVREVLKRSLVILDNRSHHFKRLGNLVKTLGLRNHIINANDELWILVAERNLAGLMLRLEHMNLDKFNNVRIAIKGENVDWRGIIVRGKYVYVSYMTAEQFADIARDNVLLYDTNGDYGMIQILSARVIVITTYLPIEMRLALEMYDYVNVYATTDFDMFPRLFDLPNQPDFESRRISLLHSCEWLQWDLIKKGKSDSVDTTAGATILDEANDTSKPDATTPNGGSHDDGGKRYVEFQMNDDFDVIPLRKKKKFMDAAIGKTKNTAYTYSNTEFVLRLNNSYKPKLDDAVPSGLSKYACAVTKCDTIYDPTCVDTCLYDCVAKFIEMDENDVDLPSISGMLTTTQTRDEDYLIWLVMALGYNLLVIGEKGDAILHVWFKHVKPIMVKVVFKNLTMHCTLVQAEYSIIQPIHITTNTYLHLTDLEQCSCGKTVVRPRATTQLCIESTHVNWDDLGPALRALCNRMEIHKELNAGLIAIRELNPEFNTTIHNEHTSLKNLMYMFVRSSTSIAESKLTTMGDSWAVPPSDEMKFRVGYFYAIHTMRGWQIGACLRSCGRMLIYNGNVVDSSTGLNIRLQNPWCTFPQVSKRESKQGLTNECCLNAQTRSILLRDSSCLNATICSPLDLTCDTIHVAHFENMAHHKGASELDVIMRYMEQPRRVCWHARGMTDEIIKEMGNTYQTLRTYCIDNSNLTYNYRCLHDHVADFIACMLSEKHIQYRRKGDTITIKNEIDWDLCKTNIETNLARVCMKEGNFILWRVDINKTHQLNSGHLAAWVKLMLAQQQKWVVECPTNEWKEMMAANSPSGNWQDGSVSVDWVKPDLINMQVEHALAAHLTVWTQISKNCYATCFSSKVAVLRTKEEMEFTQEQSAKEARPKGNEDSSKEEDKQREDESVPKETRPGANPRRKPADCIHDITLSTSGNCASIQIAAFSLVKVTYEMCDINIKTHGVFVNPANNKLQHAGGAARAIDRLTDGRLQEWSNDYIKQHGDLKTGDIIEFSCKVKPDLMSDLTGEEDIVVVNVVAPRYNRSQSDKSMQTLAVVYGNLLKFMVERKIKAFTLPLLGANIFGYKFSQSLHCLMINVLSTTIVNSNNLTINIIDNNDKTQAIFNEYCNNVVGDNHAGDCVVCNEGGVVAHNHGFMSRAGGVTNQTAITQEKNVGVDWPHYNVDNCRNMGLWNELHDTATKHTDHWWNLSLGKSPELTDDKKDELRSKLRYRLDPNVLCWIETSGDTIAPSPISDDIVKMPLFTEEYCAQMEELGTSHPQMPDLLDIIYWDCFENPTTTKVECPRKGKRINSAEICNGWMMVVRETLSEYPKRIRPTIVNRHMAETNAISTRLLNDEIVRKSELNIQQEVKLFAKTYFVDNWEDHVRYNRAHCVSIDGDASVEWMIMHNYPSKVLKEVMDMLRDGNMGALLKSIEVHIKKENVLKDGADENPNLNKGRIIAHHPYAIACIFGPIMNELKKRFKLLLNDKFVMYTDGMRPDVLNSYLQRFGYVENFVEIDMQKMDRQTDKQDLDMEFAITSLLGFEPNLAKLWRTCHENWHLKGKHTTANNDGQRLTGQASTSLGNVICSMSCSMHLIQDNRSKIKGAIFLGDDSLILSTDKVNIQHYKKKAADLYNYKVSIDQHEHCGTFCSLLCYNVAGRVKVGPDVFRLRDKMSIGYANHSDYCKNHAAKVMSFLVMLGDVGPYSSLVTACHLKGVALPWYEFNENVNANAVKNNCQNFEVLDTIADLIKMMSQPTTHLQCHRMLSSSPCKPYNAPRLGLVKCSHCNINKPDWVPNEIWGVRGHVNYGPVGNGCPVCIKLTKGDIEQLMRCVYGVGTAKLIITKPNLQYLMAHNPPQMDTAAVNTRVTPHNVVATHSATIQAPAQPTAIPPEETTSSTVPTTETQGQGNTAQCERKITIEKGKTDVVPTRTGLNQFPNFAAAEHGKIRLVGAYDGLDMYMASEKKFVAVLKIKVDMAKVETVRKTMRKNGYEIEFYDE